MQSVDTLGIQWSVSTETSSFEIAGVSTSKTLTVHRGQLQREPLLRAEFTSEGLGKKIVKLFKKEIQTGDAVFDNAVYISTDTPEATAAFLQSPEVRDVIATNVAAGGSITIEAHAVTIRQAVPDATVDAPLVRLLQAALG
jgi:hypothetical protein